MTIDTDRKWPSRPWRLRRVLALAVLALAVVGPFTAPASAHVRVFVGGAFGVPVYPYPYVRPYPYIHAYPYPPYPVYGGYPVIGPPAGVPPPGWVRGHWAWRHGDAGLMATTRIWHR